jgi:hypothetical protein
MTVKELIAHLQTFDQNLEVYTGATDGPVAMGKLEIASIDTSDQVSLCATDEDFCVVIICE